jgi:hypothetical protein
MNISGGTPAQEMPYRSIVQRVVFKGNDLLTLLKWYIFVMREVYMRASSSF